MKNKIYVSMLLATLLTSPIAKAGDVLDHPATQGAMIGAAIGCGGAVGAVADGGKMFHLTAKDYAAACLAGGVAVGAVGAAYGEGYAIITNHDAPSEQELVQDLEE